MKQLTDIDTKKVLEKLYKYVGENVKLLLDRPDGKYCLRQHKSRVFYVSEKVLKAAQHVAPDNFVGCGTCLGKFTKTGRFYLSITALSHLAPLAQYKVWVKPGAEQQFLYGNNILKSGLGRITENTAKHQGVVVFSMSDLPLGFGLSTKSTAECKHASPTTMICVNQADIGLYLRSEDTLT